MKFIVPSRTLYNITSGVSKVINAKNALTILNNFLFSLEGPVLSITGSDVENSLTARISVTDYEGEGQFCVDARYLVDLLKLQADQPLEIEVDDETLELTMSSQSGRYKMMATPGDLYPAYSKEEDSEEPKTFTITSEQMQKGINSTLFAIGTDDFQPQMMGIYLDIKPDNITFVATDARKLVRFRSSECKPGIEASCIMPAKPAVILNSVFAKEDNLTITLTSRSATIESDTFLFNCRFIKGRFPDYNRVIPANNPYTLRVDRMRFLNAVRRVGVFVDPGFGLEKFKITPDRLYLKSCDANVSKEGDERLDCEYDGPELIIGFSAPYLIEICNVLPTENIVVNLSDPSRPGVFHPDHNEGDTDLLILLMPMNVVDF